MRHLACVFFLVLSLPTAAATIMVEDYLGRTVQLPEPAKRIVALAPHVVENLYSAGAGDRLVAAVEFADYPAEAQALPRIGAFNTVSLEGILALKPDLVVSWLSGNGLSIVEQLRRLGVPVYADEPKTLEDIARSIRDLGRLAGTEAVSNAVAEGFLSRLQILEVRSRDASQLTVFYQVWHQPLQTVNDEHIISDVLGLCGGNNIFGDAASLAPVISVESVLERNPDVILASGPDENRPGWLDEWQRFPSLRAVQANNLMFVPADYLQRHTLRILDGAEMVCEQFQRSREKAGAE